MYLQSLHNTLHTAVKVFSVKYYIDGLMIYLKNKLQPFMPVKILQ